MKKLIINNNEIRNLTGKICRDITVSGWKPDFVIGLTRGGLVPAVMISHWFQVPLETLKVTLCDGNYAVSDLKLAQAAADLKNILIVDDINDSGATFNWILADWSKTVSETPWDNIWNHNVKFATLVQNISSNFYASTDYSGLEINKEEDNSWIVFPWENWWESNN
jgi:hypoxanthine phosphoribosyltransferase